MLESNHPNKKLLEDHDTQDALMKEFAELGYVDLVGAIQAVYDMSAVELGELRVHQLMKMTLHVFDRHMEYVNWSRYCRENYVMCHPDCHALRIQHFVKHGHLHSVT